MSCPLSRWQQPDAEGRTRSVTSESAGWEYVDSETYELEEGWQLTLSAVGEECCLVLVAGRAFISAPSTQFTDIGERMSPFERTKLWAVYVTPREATQARALTKLELTVCTASRKRIYPTWLIAPQDTDGEARGNGRNQRYVHSILPEDRPADSLLVVEAWANEGCTSSHPSHRHDMNNPPQENYLKETYYHHPNPGQGFRMQRMYTDDCTLDERVAIYNHDVAVVLRRCHSVAAAAGYDSHYLNVMAGPVREWIFTWEKERS